MHEQGACVRRVSQRLKIVKGEDVLHVVRLRDLERLVLFGNIELTAQALAVLLDEGIETVLLTATGRLRGRLQPAEGKNVLLRQAQFQRHADAAFRLRTARAIVQGKIRNARGLVSRYLRNHDDAACKQALGELDRAQENVQRQDAIDQLLGIEGDAARSYFEAFAVMLRGELPFHGRSRRPPKDPVNAVLSFGYTLLMTELVGLLAAQGLDPQVGFLHELAYGRPSLALDLLEEFRQPAIDRLTLTLVNLKVLKAGQFEEREAGGVYLNESGRPVFLDCYHQALDEPFACRDAPGEERTAFRALMQRQAHRMRESIEYGQDYAPYQHHARS